MIKNNKRVLQVYKAYSPQEGGIPTIIKYLSEGLIQNSYQEVLCTKKLCSNNNNIVNGIIVNRITSFGEILSLPISPNFPLSFWKMASQFDIVDYHFPMPWVDLSVACYFPKKTKLIIHWHSDIVRQKMSMKLISPAIKKCLQRADKIIVADESYTSNWLSPFKNKCLVVPFGIDIPFWSKTNSIEEEKIGLLRSQYRRFILAVGRLVPYKGFSVLIQAMQHVDAELIIVGRGILEFKLKELVRQLDMSHKVHFWGKASDFDSKCLYHAADIFAFSSITENEVFGIVQLEAMACKKPIINTALNTAVSNVARHQIEALTVPPNNVEALHEALNKILQDKMLYNKLSENSFKRVCSNYSMENFLLKTLKIYEDL